MTDYSGKESAAKSGRSSTSSSSLLHHQQQPLIVVLPILPIHLLPLLLLLLFLAPLPVIAQQCPNRCSGHGQCSGDKQMKCFCGDGWTGVDCSRRTCPSAAAWVAVSRLDDDAHTQVLDCANMGICNEQSGQCECFPGFSGPACEKMDCPGSPICSGNGRCITLRQAGLGYDGLRLLNLPVVYDRWDADRIQGCLCDMGFTGVDCSLKQCPLGDDPLTPGVPEIQKITCSCQNSFCEAGGYFTVSFAGRTARILGSAVASIADESASSLPGSGSAIGESFVSRLGTLRDAPTFLSVEYHVGTSACGPGAAATITFLNGAGNMPEMKVSAGTMKDAANLAPFMDIVTVQEATTERAPCSNRGTCSFSSGTCTCFKGLSASDGNGNPGTIPDCGSLKDQVTGIVSNITECPASDCSLRGICTLVQNIPTCDCFQGASGPKCNERPCPIGRAWFDEPSDSDGSAHAPATCSNRGICLPDSGTCKCSAGFIGGACDRIACPSLAGGDSICSGHGQCLPLRDLARTGSFEGARIGRLEKQQFTCALTSGTFRISMHHSFTPSIPFDVTIKKLKRYIEVLPGVISIGIRSKPEGVTSACLGGGSEGVTLELTFFEQDQDIPLLEVHYDTGNGFMSMVGIQDAHMTQYGANTANPDTWDADMFFGCSCDGMPDWNQTSALGTGDRSSWYGPACSARTCPIANDPLITLEPDTPRLLTEVQVLSCGATDGSFTITFRGRTTVPIHWSDNERVVKQKLEALPSIGRIKLQMDPPGAICHVDTARTTVTFISELGDLPLMTVDTFRLWPGFIVTVSESVKGTAQGVGGSSPTIRECGGHGICDAGTGLCTCFPGWFSSNGTGWPGTRGDCGHYDVTGLV